MQIVSNKISTLLIDGNTFLAFQVNNGQVSSPPYTCSCPSRCFRTSTIHMNHEEKRENLRLPGNCGSLPRNGAHLPNVVVLPSS